MGFTYDAKNPTTRDKLRRKIGDKNAGNPVFQDEELDSILSEQSSDLYLSAAAACREMATMCARGAVIVTLPGKSISRVSQPGIFQDMAKAFEAEAIQRAVPTEVNVTDQTGEQLEISLGRLDFDLDFTSEPNA